MFVTVFFWSSKSPVLFILLLYSNHHNMFATVFFQSSKSSIFSWAGSTGPQSSSLQQRELFTYRREEEIGSRISLNNGLDDELFGHSGWQFVQRVSWLLQDWGVVLGKRVLVVGLWYKVAKKTWEMRLPMLVVIRLEAWVRIPLLTPCNKSETLVCSKL